MGNDKTTGGCLCGAIRYEADHAPVASGYCHCRVCQKSLGNLFSASVGFKPSGFRFLSGEPVWYWSSDLVRRGFCGKCGSPIAYQRDDAELIATQIGTLDHPEKYELQAHFYTDTKIPWVDIQSHLPDKTTEMPSYKASNTMSKNE